MIGKHERWFEAMAADVQANKQGVAVARMASMFGFKCAQSVYNQQDGVQDLTFQQYFAYAAELATMARAPYNLVAWVCRQAGCMWAPLPPAGASIDARLPKMLSEFGDLTKALVEGMEDNNWSMTEAERVWTEGEQAISAMLGVMHAAREAALKAASTIPMRPATLAEAEMAAPRAKGNGGAA